MKMFSLTRLKPIITQILPRIVTIKKQFKYSQIKNNREISKKILFGFATTTVGLSSCALLMNYKFFNKTFENSLISQVMYTMPNYLVNINKNYSKTKNEDEAVSVESIEKKVNKTLYLNEQIAKLNEEHISLLKSAFENSTNEDDTMDWEKINELIQKREKFIKDAATSSAEVKSEIDNLIESINKNEEECEDDNLEKLRDFRYTLTQSETKLYAIEEEGFDVYKQFYSDVIKDDQSFETELQSLLAYIKKCTCDPDEMVKLALAHCKQKINRVNRRLHRQILSEKDRLEEALEAKMCSMEEEFNTRLNASLEEKVKLLEMENSSKFLQLEKAHEDDLQANLFRVTSAHCRHLQDEVEKTKNDSNAKNEQVFLERLHAIRQELCQEIEEVSSKLQNMSQFYCYRAYLDTATKLAQSMWLACEDLVEMLKYGMPEPRQPLSLEQNLEALRDNLPPNDNFIPLLLQSFPEQAVSRGIFCETYLKERFKTVDKRCQEACLINAQTDRGLFKHLLSYLYPQFLYRLPPAEIPEAHVDPREWDMCDVLGRIRCSLETNNLEQALRYANQLTGRPREIALDWMREVKLLLETRLVVQALSTYVSSLGIQAYL